MAKHKQPSAEDSALWRQVTRDVRPLPGGAAPAAETPAAETPAPAVKAKAPARPAPGRRETPPPRPAASLEKGDIVGVDKRTVARLRRGKLPVEGRLDLHGLSQAEAERALARFLAASQAAGRRCVLVITGKGALTARRGGAEAPGEPPGVLRRRLPQWLNDAENRARVLAFAEARAEHGGAGAIYLLLKRKRPL